jgi:hypothetical protein
MPHEPPLYATVSNHPSTWSVRIPARLRDYREVTSVGNYIDRVAESVRPEALPTPVSAGLPDLPTALGYLDAVWRSATGSHLFAHLDPVSTVRLTHTCSDEEGFNSLMSALADVLAQVVQPGKAKPPERAALEDLRSYLRDKLDDDPAERVEEAINTLIRLRKIRVGGQHSDARPKAVKAFAEIGLPFPPVRWEQAWIHVAWLAKNALDAIREETIAGLT